MDTETAIKSAQAPTTFDVLAFVEQTAYPTETVVVFQDVTSADKYVKLVNQRSEYDKNPEAHALEIASITEQLETLADAIRKSSIIFDLRGMPPGIVQSLLKVPEGEDEQLNETLRDNKLIASTIIGVRNVEGIEDPRVWDADDVAKLRSFLKEGEFGKLMKAVGDVNFNAAVFDQATDAGFSSRGNDVAA